MTRVIPYDPNCPAADEPFATALAFSHVQTILQDASFESVVFAIGAGVSTSAGLPDFRSKKGGLYHSASPPPPTSSSPSGASSSYPRPRTSSPSSLKPLFHSSVYRVSSTRSRHFELMAKLHQQARAAEVEAERVRGSVTRTHGLFRTLKSMGKLRRVYTQNIDALEGSVGLSMAPLAGLAEDDKVDDWNYDVVQLHGSLSFVRCAACEWVGDWGEDHTEAFADGDSVDCPVCAERSSQRQKSSKRALSMANSFLRPAILLYDEPITSSASTRIANVSSQDLSSSPEVLFVMGSSLKIPGFKELVKEMASSVHENREGLVIFVNLEAVGNGWNEVFDYHFQTRCDDFVDRLLEEWQSSCPNSFWPSCNLSPLS